MGKSEEFYGKDLSRHQAYWQAAPADRPIFGCNLGLMATDHCPLTMKNIKEGLIHPNDINIELFLQDCDDLYLKHNRIGDDYPFVASPCVYVPWMEAIMGCPIYASETSIWAEPCVTDWETWEWKSIGVENKWTAKLLEVMDALVKHTEGRYPVSATLMRGPADIIAAMRGAAQFPMDMLDYPDTMKDVVKKCTDAFIEIGKMQQNMIPESQNGYMDGDRGFRVWAPEKMLWLQEDAMALISPSIYREFLLEEDRRICKAFPAIAFHLHGSALWAVDDLIAISELNAIELNFEAAACDVEGTFQAWKKISDAGRPVVVWRLYEDDFEPWLDRVLKELPAQGVSIQVTVKDVAQAKSVNECFLIAAGETYTGKGVMQ